MQEIALLNFRLPTDVLVSKWNNFATKATGNGSLEAVTALRKAKKCSSLISSSFTSSCSKRLK